MGPSITALQSLDPCRAVKPILSKSGIEYNSLISCHRDMCERETRSNSLCCECEDDCGQDPSRIGTTLYDQVPVQYPTSAVTLASNLLPAHLPCHSMPHPVTSTTSTPNRKKPKLRPMLSKTTSRTALCDSDGADWKESVSFASICTFDKPVLLVLR